MDNIKLYEVDPDYVTYMADFAPHVFHNKQTGQSYERKFIGIVFSIRGIDYFAPLSSFKDKHIHMPETLDFLKIKRYAVINLNNMFPVPEHCRNYVDIAKISDSKYKSLLLAEYRIIKSMQTKIRKNAAEIYKHRTENGEKTKLGKRCNDFALLEEAYHKYQ